MDQLLLQIGYNGVETKVMELRAAQYYSIAAQEALPITPTKSDAAWGNITGNIDDQKDLINKLDGLKSTVEKELLEKLDTAFTYKGSVTTKESLPENPNVGDVYYVESEDKNYTFNGETWDETSSLNIDLSDYLTKEEITELLQGYCTIEYLDGVILSLEDRLNTEISKRESEKAAIDKVIVAIDDILVKVQENIKTLRENIVDLSSTVEKNSKDIQNKANKSEVYSKTEVDETLSLYAKKSDIPSISGGVTEDFLNEKLLDYAKLTDIPEDTVTHDELKEYAKLSDIPEITSGITEEELNTRLEEYAKTTDTVSKAEIEEKNYANKDEVITKEELPLDDVITEDRLNNALSDYVKVEEIPTDIVTHDEIKDFITTEALTDYATKEELPKDVVTHPELDEYAKKSDIPSISGGITEEQLTERLQNYTAKEDFTLLENTVSTQSGGIQSLLIQLQELEKRIEDLKSLDPEIVVLYEGGDSEFMNKEKDFILSGVVNTPTKISGNTVTLKDATITAAFVQMLAAQDINLKGVTLTGKVPKILSNYLFSVNADGYITIRDCVVNTENAYNGIEINLYNGLSKSVTIDNVDFSGRLNNNGINIFGMAENGVVTISNCHFSSLSNVVRVSNKTNTSWTLNLINCTVDEWEDNQYAGLILLQDYTSGSKEKADENNIFHKITINIQNLTKPDGSKLTPVEDLSSICSTKDPATQIIYMWDEWRNFTPYSVDVFPVINIQ